MITHPVAAAARGFSHRWGFVDVPFDPKIAIIIGMVHLEKRGITKTCDYDDGGIW